MATYLHHIETVVPKFAYEQADIASLMKAYLGQERKTEKLLARIYKQSGIQTRYSVLRHFTEPNPDHLFFGDTLLAPTTKTRNDIYAKEARDLFVCTAHNAIARTRGITEFDITHVITVSCTGFFAPGPDYFVVQDLGLNASVERFHVGFMGCYAAFPALKMAQAFCEADENAVVLVLCVELCTLHLQAQEDADNLIAASVFADGGAAAILSQRFPHEACDALELKSFDSSLVPDGEKDMAWTVGDTGFEMILSSYVPRLLEANIAEAVSPLLKASGIRKADIQHWAIHPGGRAILDKVKTGLELKEADLESARAILRNYGNMSSATILFVLQACLKKAKRDDLLYGMAFGPGLTVESGLFRKV